MHVDFWAKTGKQMTATADVIEADHIADPMEKAPKMTYEDVMQTEVRKQVHRKESLLPMHHVWWRGTATGLGKVEGRGESQGQNGIKSILNGFRKQNKF